VTGRWRLALLLLAFGASAAHAGTDSDLLAKFGLIGSWAIDCHAPPSVSNPFQIFVPSNYGEPTRQLIVSNPNYDRIMPIHDVFLITGDRLRLSYEQNGIPVTIVLVKEGNRVRPLESTTGNGLTPVSGGIVQSNGQQTAWLEKCSD
jgi:hypothetical protein